MRLEAAGIGTRYLCAGASIAIFKEDYNMPEQITLNDGNAIPQLGLGVWQVDQAITADVVGWAIEAGYRSIDTAEGYANEEGVGQAIRKAQVPRGELFITSKLRNGAHQRDAALRAFDETMTKLGIEQIDLFLIHWPVPSQDKYVEAWKTLVELQKAGPHQVGRRLELQ